jgi:NAD(P)-dependent dehydrogenase (short-subunit alcohol dehydrogenase family)
VSARAPVPATTADRGQNVAIVTGGSKGIGAGIAAGYRELGWSVVATARTIKPSDDPDLFTIEGDISSAPDAARIVSQALARFGHIDTLVNNAGVFMSKPFTDYSAEDYATVLGANLTGFFALSQLVVRHMLGRGRGHLVNMTATLAEYSDSSSPAVLPALTKGGLASATKSLAIEYAASGIRVNAVSPGVIQTPQHPPESYVEEATRTPLGRVGQVDDIVRAVLFLEASPFITGEIVHVDGGRSAGR